MDRQAELERMAESIADEAVSGYEKIVSPAVIAEMRRVLIFDMLATEEGLAELRRCLDDPVVAKSDDIDTSGKPLPGKVKSGGGSGVT